MSNRTTHFRHIVPLLALTLVAGCSEERQPDEQMPLLVNASQIVITHIGNPSRPAGIKRTFADAMQLARDLRKRIDAGEDFAKLAREYSEDESATRGGSLGNVAPMDLPPMIRDTVLELKVGEITDPVTTQVGIHIIIRQPLAKLIGARHILVAYRGAMRAAATRSKEEARARAEECLKRLTDGAPFEDLALEYSDGPSRTRGGDLGTFARGAMVPEFEEAAYACEVGGTTGIVESPFGFHIIRRYQ